ncbi:MAG: hypothetical protein WAL97_06295 [Halobacteriota archaeon]
MHERTDNGGGMGPYMSYGMNANTRSQMQQEMQEHVGSGVGLGMMGVFESYTVLTACISLHS